MEKIVTQTGKKKLIIDTEYISNQFIITKITVDNGGYETKRTIELTNRQVQKLIDELQTVLVNHNNNGKIK